MNILLASAPHADTFGYSMPPPGLLRLGGALRDAGHSPALEDLAFSLANGRVSGGEDLAQSSAEQLQSRGKPDLVGLSVMGATLPVALEIARHLREAWPETPILLGGPGAHATAGALLERFPQIDAVVRGEAEETIVEVCDAFQRHEPLWRVAGVSARDGDTVVHAPERTQRKDLSDLPAYAWDLLPSIRSYKEITGEGDGLVALDSGRGCVYDCSFCSIGRTWSRRSRPLPASQLADEVASLQGIPGARRAYLCHDIFGADRKHAMEFTREMIEREIGVPWEVRARADHMDAELLRAMGHAGCDRVLLGIESASPDVRERNQKGMARNIDILTVVRDCAAAGITPILSLILGLPGEDDDALDASLTLCADAALTAGVNLSLHLVNPQPGCALGDEFGPASRPAPGVSPDMALGAGLSGPERALIDAHPDLFSTWSLLPYDDATRDELVAFSSELPEALMRFPRAFAALRLLTGDRVLTLARALRADGRTFETFARATAGAAQSGESGVTLIDELIAWETAMVQLAARGPRPAAKSQYRLSGLLLPSRLDLGTVSETLLGGLQDRGDSASAALAGLLETSGGAGASGGAVGAGASETNAQRDHEWFAIAHRIGTEGALTGIRTLRLGAGAVKLLQRLDENDRRTVSGSPQTDPHMRAALDQPTVRAALDEMVRLGILLAPQIRRGSPRHPVSPAGSNSTTFPAPQAPKASRPKP